MKSSNSYLSIQKQRHLERTHALKEKKFAEQHTSIDTSLLSIGTESLER